MKRNFEQRERLRMRFGGGVLGVAVALALMGQGALGQTADTVSTEKAGTVVRQEINTGARVDSRPYETFYLKNATQQNDANEITVAIRNLLPPDIKLYLVPNQSALTMRGTPDQIALAQKIVNDLDRPKKVYRLTYTIADMEGGKRVGTQHFALVATVGQRTVLKQGNKVPIMTGSVTEGTSTSQMQVTYIDIGLNLDATLDEFANGVRLRTKVEQLSVAEERSGIGSQDPVIRQTSLEGTSFLTPGKPLMLGSLDVPGSTRHLDVDVMMEQVVP